MNVQMPAIYRAVILIVLFAVCLAANGCSTHISALQAAPNEQAIYKLDEKKAFELAYNVLLEKAPADPIGDLTGPIRGFAVTRRWALDYYTTMVRIFPGKGKDSSGVIQFGYYLEVSGTGTLFNGPSFDQDVYDETLSLWKAAGEEIKVHKISRAEYIYDRDRWRLSDRPSLREPPKKAVIGQSQETAIQEKLRTLKKLHDDGLISEEEYKTKRAEVLKAY